MCGIIGYIGNKDVVPILLEGLKRLEYRGYDSAGIAILDGDRIRRRRVKGKISALESSLKQEELTGNFGIGHTRWATHGRPSEENAHPHQDCTGDFVVVHNGIIENYLAIKQELRTEGHEFVTETDTEVIAHLVEKYFQGSLEEAVLQAIKRLEGAFAIAAVSTRDRDKLVLAKMGPPAVVGLGEGENFISSDINPLLSYTQDIVFLEDGEMAVVAASSVRFFDFDGKALDKRVDRIKWNPLMIEKSGFKHFMLKEIFEQPGPALSGHRKGSSGRDRDRARAHQRHPQDHPHRLRHLIQCQPGRQVLHRGPGRYTGGCGVCLGVPVQGLYPG